MTIVDDLLKNNERYTATFDAPNLAMPPAKQVAIVVCMDARIHPESALGLQLGDAHMIRNAGGRMADALRSLAISQTLLGTKEVAVIHHTDCGMLTFTEEGIRQKLRDELGAEPGGLAFLPFSDLEASVREDIRIYEHSPMVRHDVPVRGFIYDVSSGRLDEVS